MRACIPSSELTLSFLIVGLIMLAPLLSRVEGERTGHIKLLLNSLLLLLFPLGITVFLRLVGPIHLSVKEKLIGGQVASVFKHGSCSDSNPMKLSYMGLHQWIL